MVKMEAPAKAGIPSYLDQAVAWGAELRILKDQVTLRRPYGPYPILGL